jgi:predicted MFS family arabinose efflux permease
MSGSIGLGAAGSIVAAFGYNAAFLTLAAVAVIALLVMVVAMPETRPTPGKLDQPLLGVVPEPEPPGRHHSCQLANLFVFARDRF